MVTIGFYAGLIVLAVAVWLLTQYIDNKAYTIPPPDDPAALSRAEDAYAAVGNLLTTLATGLLAALGLFLTGTPKRRDSGRELWPATLSAVCVCLSVYFGYISSQNVGWAIEYSIPTLDLPKIQWPRELQFYAILLGVFFFADFVRQDRTKVN
jgi:thiol:disulfide interchange protein